MPPTEIIAAAREGLDPTQPLTRPEYLSLITWNQLHFQDPGAYNISNIYRSVYGLPPGENIAAHFFAACGALAHADAATNHLVGLFSYGAIFAVNRDRRALVPRAVISRLREASLAHSIHGYILEKLWLHLFGCPFLLPVKGVVPGRWMGPFQGN